MVLVTLAVVVGVLTRAFRGTEPETAAELSRSLEDAKLAKYRELRELELDWGTGKLADSDYNTSRGQLRQEAAALLERATPGAEDPPPTNGAST